MAVVRQTMVEPVSPPGGLVPGTTAPGLPTSLLLVVAALSACITAQGGYYAGGQLITGILLAAALVTALRARPLSLHDLRLPPVLAAIGLAGWAVVVTLVVGGNALPVVALLTALCTVLLVCRRTSAADREALAVATLGIGVLVALSGWAGVAWRIDPLALEDQGLWRAATTLTYANAAAGLLVPLVLLALGRAVARPASPLNTAGLCVLLAGAGATLSRGGAVALVAGLACLAAGCGPRRTARALMPATLGALVALAALAPSMPAGAASRPLLAVTGIIAGVLIAVALGSAPARVPTIALVAALGAGAILVTVGPLDGAWRSVSGARITMASPDRQSETSAAVGLVGDRPLTGTGPGRATLFFSDADGQPVAARYAHNEYLQVLIELGVVGLALTVFLLGALARSVGAGRATAPSQELWVGAAAGLVALGVHSAFDFLWHVPALPLAAALLVGLTIPALPTAKEHA